MKEYELYDPLKEKFEKLGYSVRGEVKNCDLVAEKDGRFVAVEMKTSFNLKLVYQALERRKLAEEVYVCIPRPKTGARSRSWRNMTELLKELKIGLITIAMDSPLKMVEVVIESGERERKGKKAEGLKKEFEGRNLDLNTGGVNKTKLITAYREKSIKMASLAVIKNEVSLKEARELGCDESEVKTFGSNHYGWFDRVRTSVYKVNEKCLEEIKEEKYKVIFEYYTNYFRS
ncbi:MAG: hypothetical protein IJF29_01070 [Firmicutes bacterium]|nr:hypothetical protein [Bacillota bacterium]